jgi:hypothetical protein
MKMYKHYKEYDFEAEFNMFKSIVRRECSANPDDLYVKADRFTTMCKGLRYPEFVKRSNPCAMTGDAYDLLTRNDLKERLFDTRAKVYLAALYDFTMEGGEINAEMLNRIINADIPFLKRGAGTEPTFEVIFELVQRHFGLK